MTLFEMAPVVCKHGRTALEMCAWCEAAEKLSAAQNATQAPYVAGSQTSFEAARAIKPDRARLKQRVYQAICDQGPLCDEQIAGVTWLNPSTARPRRLELLREGRIEFCGYTRTQAGRKAKVWRVVPDSDQG